ncbi:MAG: hypothetical protein M9921_05675 [Fimbriimonadaceae bacterium]|nr:hypothetical protein [Fimbriimonadaceae bacterium]
MDEELRNVLGEIAAELRTRNDMMREQVAQREEMRSKFLGSLPFGSGNAEGEGKKSFGLEAIDRAHKESLQRIYDDADRDRSERREFQDALLAEIRRLNDLLQALVSRSQGG